MKTQDSYTRYKQPVRVFSRRKVIAASSNQQWQTDIMDMTKFFRINRGYKYVLVVIDVFSKKAYVRPLKTKGSLPVVDAFQSIVNEAKAKPFKVSSDKGREFLNQHLSKWCKKMGIKWFTSEDDVTKAMIAERFIRTLKKKLLMLMMHKNRNQWYEELQDIVTGYNNRVHSSTGFPPNKVTKENTSAVFFKLYPPPTCQQMKKPKNILKIGDKVRLLHKAMSLRKAIYTQWTSEIFVIEKVIPRYENSIYKVKDLKGEDVLGFFYQNEIQKVIVNT